MLLQPGLARWLLVVLTAMLLFAIGSAAWARGGLAGGGSVAPFTPTIYYVTGFNSPTSGPLQLEQSYDGISWSMTTITYINSPTFVRDPNILVDRSQRPVKVNGLYWLSHTNTSSNSSTYSLASSPDLRTWTFVQNVSCAPVLSGGANDKCWGPTMYLDDSGGMHTITGMCANCPSQDHFQLYEMHPPAGNPAGTWSLPTLIQFSPAFDNVLPGWIYRDATSTRRFFVNHVGAAQTHCTEEWISTSDFTGYTALHTGSWNSWGCGREINVQALHIGALFYFSLNDDVFGDVVSTTTDPTGTTFTNPINANFGNFNAIGFFQVPGGIAPPPPTPVSMSFSPSAPQIADNSLSGTQVATITVGMSDGSLFNGTLTFAPPTTCTLGTCFGNNSGMFAVSTSPTVLSLGRNLVAGDDGTNSATVAATQNGTTFEATVPVTVTSSNITPPSQAAAAGFTTLAANFDFVNNQMCVGATCVAASPISNWLDCAGTDASKFWHSGWPGAISSLPCNVQLATDGGVTVLDIQYLPSYSSHGFTSNQNSVSIQTITNGSPANGGVLTFGHPVGVYVEATYRATTGNDGSAGSELAVWEWSSTSPCTIDLQLAELFTNTTTGFSAGSASSHCPGRPSMGMWASYDGGANLPSGYNVTSYFTYGILRTTNASNSILTCGYVNNVLIVDNTGTGTNGCVDQFENTSEFAIRSAITAWVAAGSNPYPSVINDILIKSIRVWSCAGWATGQCNGSTLVGTPQNGAVSYWH